MKHFFKIMTVALLVTAMSACNDDNGGSNGNNGGNNNNNGGNNTATTPINRTYWSSETGDISTNDWMFVDASFGIINNEDQSFHPEEAAFNKSYSASNGGTRSDRLKGPYTYSGTATEGSGTITLTDYQHGGEVVGTASFTVSGQTLTLEFLGETYTLTKD